MVKTKPNKHDQGNSPLNNEPSSKSPYLRNHADSRAESEEFYKNDTNTNMSGNKYMKNASRTSNIYDDDTESLAQINEGLK